MGEADDTAPSVTLPSLSVVFQAALTPVGTMKCAVASGSGEAQAAQAVSSTGYISDICLFIA